MESGPVTVLRDAISEQAAGTTAGRKTLEHVYGFDDVAIVPGAVTTNPDMVDLSFALGGHSFALPMLASSMDAVVDTQFAGRLSARGGLAVLHIEGVQTRYEDPAAVLPALKRGLARVRAGQAAVLDVRIARMDGRAAAGGG